MGRHYIKSVKKDSELDTEWFSEAHCKGAGVDMFFFEDRRDREARQRVQEAKEICKKCPVIKQCLNYALEAPMEWGVWGGLSSSERWHIRLRRSKSPPRETEGDSR